MQTTPFSGFLVRDDKSWQQCLESSYTV
ncbi:MAG: hypothetical protein RL650_1795, partial [Pseudomonadota bacterium]